jgi:hypothetical protein
MHKSQQQKDLNTEIADAFWSEFKIYERPLKDHLLKLDESGLRKANAIIDSIKKILNIDNNIGIQFGVGTRNGLVLPERENTFEIIISPMFQRTNKGLMSELYTMGKGRLGPEWSLIKYKFWQPANLETMTLTYPVADSNKVMTITKDDFSFYPVIDSPEHGHSEKLAHVDLLLFIDDDKLPYLAKKETIEFSGEAREIYIPNNPGIYAMLDAAIGEYNVLNVLDKMEIHPESIHKEIERKPLNKLIDTIKMVSNNPMSSVKQCARCNYSNLQTSIHACACGKVYYCDTICQKACRKKHKVNCV